MNEFLQQKPKSIQNIIQKMSALGDSSTSGNQIIPVRSLVSDDLFVKNKQDNNINDVLGNSLQKIFNILNTRNDTRKSNSTINTIGSFVAKHIPKLSKILKPKKTNSIFDNIIEYFTNFQKEWKITNSILKQHTKLFQIISKNITDIEGFLTRDRLSELEQARENNKNKDNFSLFDNNQNNNKNQEKQEKGLFSRLADFIIPLFGANFLGRMFTAIPGIAAVRNIFKNIPKLFNNIRNVIQKIPKLLTNVKNLFLKIPNILSNITKSIKNLPSILSGFLNNIRNIPNVISNKITGMKNTIANSTVGKTVSSGISKAKSLATGGLNLAKSAGSSVMEFGKSTGSKLLSMRSKAGNFIGSVFSKAKTLSKDAMKSKLATGVKKALPNIGKHLGKFFGPVLTAILSAVDLYSTVNSAKAEAADQITTNPQSAKAALEKGKEKIGISVAKGLGSVGGSILGGVLGSFIPVPGLGTIIGALGGNFVGGMVGNMIGESIGGKEIYESLSPMLESLGLGLDDFENTESNTSTSQQPMTSSPQSGGLVQQLPMMDVRSVNDENSLSNMNFMPVKNNTETDTIKSLEINEASKFAKQYSQQPVSTPITSSVNQINNNNQNSYFVGRQYYRAIEPETIKRSN